MEKHKAFTTAAILHLLGFLRIILPLQSWVLHYLHFHHFKSAKVWASSLAQSPQNYRLCFHKLSSVCIVRELSSAKNWPKGEALHRKPPPLHPAISSSNASSIVAFTTAIPTKINAVD